MINCANQVTFHPWWADPGGQMAGDDQYCDDHDAEYCDDGCRFYPALSVGTNRKSRLLPVEIKLWLQWRMEWCDHLSWCLYLYLYLGLQIPWERNNSCGEVKKRSFGSTLWLGMFWGPTICHWQKGQWDSGGGGQERGGIGAARNADKFVEPSLARGPQGAKEAKGHHTKGGAASSAKFSQ